MKNKLLFLLIGMLLTALPVSNADLIAHYLCDETSGTDIEDSMGTYDSTVSNAAMWDASGKIGGDCYANDLYYINDVNFGTVSTWSITFWWKPDTTYSANHNWFISDTGNYGGVGTLSNTGIETMSSAGSNSPHTVDNMGAGVWHFVAITETSGSVNVYLNTTASVSNPSTRFFGLSGLTGLLNYQVDSLHEYVPDGRIDDIRIYNEIITAANISFIFNSGAGTQNNFTLDVSDTTPPIINSSFNVSLSSIYLKDVINVTFNATDETSLTWVNITYNTSGVITYLNYSVSGTRAEIHNTTITSSSSAVINVTGYAVDGNNNVKQNSTLLIFQDNIVPIVNVTLNLTAIRINNVINITANITDETGLSGCQFIENMTLSNGQKTYTNISISGTSAECSNKYTISLSRGNVINFTVIANDTSNNKKMNDTIITVANTIPNGTNFINTTGLLRKTNQTFNWSSAFDPDTDTLDYVLYWGTSNPPVNLYYNGTKNNVTTNLTADNTYFYQIKAMDDSSESTLSPVFNFTLDTVTPTDNLLTTIPNLTFTNKNVNFTIQADDSNLEGHNVTAFAGDGLSGTIKFSTELSNIAGTTNNIKVEINTSWGDGRYTIVSNESDDHNEPIEGVIKRLRNLLYRHPTNDAEYVRNVFYKPNQNISVWVAYKNGNTINRLTKTQAQNYNMQRLTYIGNEGYEFGFLSDLPNTNIIFGFVMEKSDKLILRNNATAHFKWGKDYYIDFDAEINGTSINPLIKETTNYWEIYYTPDWVALGFKTGDVINFTTKSIGGVNFGSSLTQIEIDTGIPQFFDLNLSSSRIMPNNTFISANILNFTFNVSDKNNNTVLFYVNNAKNITSGYISNQSKNATITFIDGNYTILIEINDSVGNKINSSFINIVVDTAIPTFVETVNRTTANSTNILDNTDVNLSVFGISDIYLKDGNFSENASGTWTNHSSFNNGNGTYHLMISQNNLTANQVVGWKFYAYDLSGNELDPIYTFIVGSSAVATAATSGTAGGGGGGILGRCDPFAQTFNTCFYYDGIACVKGCPVGFECNNALLKCEQKIRIGIQEQTTKEQEQELTLFQRLWLKLKSIGNNVFSFVISPTSTEPLGIIPIIEQKQEQGTSIVSNMATDAVEAISEKMQDINNGIKQKPYLALSIMGIIAIAIAFIQLNMALFMPPYIWFIIGYYSIVAILWFFRVLD